MQELIKHRLFQYILVLSIFILNACDKDLPEPGSSYDAPKISEQQKILIESSNEFAIDILKANYSQAENRNILLSPLSLGMSLGMIYNGVGINEKLEIESVLGLESFDERSLNKTFSQVSSVLQANEKIDITFSNSLWYPNDLIIDEFYKTRVMAYYDAEVGELNFKHSSSINYVNKMCEQRSMGEISQLITTLPSRPNIFLINAIKLNTSWNIGQEPYMVNQMFSLSDKEEIEIPMYQWPSIEVKINQADGFTYLDVPFNESYFDLSIILPDASTNIHDLLNKLSNGFLCETENKASDMTTGLSIPSLSLDDEMDQKTSLSDLGLTDLFSNKIDLSPSFIKERVLSIDNIKHRAIFSFNNSEYSSQPEFVASIENSGARQISIDRPFIFFVREHSTKAILYSGIYRTPEL